MGQLLLDLRDNPGGPLDQAISVSNQFLPRGDMIVYTRGRVSNSDQDYHARDESDFSGLPIIVLVNRSSASASEIVAGALQDHDRALVVGETTFGKALVQSIYRVSHGAGLALTTARYYTPSGRMIQRPWDGTFDEYLTYSLREQETPARAPADRKFTDAGREVYSGGGIEPDHFMAGPIRGFDPSRLGRLLAARGDFAYFARRFSAVGDTRIPVEGTDRELVDRGFDVRRPSVERVQGAGAQPRPHGRRRRVRRRHRLHPRDDSIRGGPRPVRRGGGVAQPVPARPPGAVRRVAVRGGPQPPAAVRRRARSRRPVEPVGSGGPSPHRSRTPGSPPLRCVLRRKLGSRAALLLRWASATLRPA